jgi:hypothetical protein
VEFHDLSQVFRNIKEPIYVDNCCHVSHEANVILAQRMGSLMLETLK